MLDLLGIAISLVSTIVTIISIVVTLINMKQDYCISKEEHQKSNHTDQS